MNSTKTIFIYLFVVIWLGHLITGAGAGFAAYRIWPERKLKFVLFTMIHLHAAMLDSISAIVLLFVSKGVVFTWRFSIVLFGFAFIRDIVRLPLIMYVLRGPKALV